MKRTSLFAVLLLVAVPVSAQETHDSISKTFGNDLYIAGENVTTTAAAADDVIIAGATVRITQPVAGDIAAFGGTIDIDADVRGDVRAFGGDIRITGTINGDVFVAGGSLIIAEDAVINGSIVVFGGDVTMNGDVGGELWLRGGRLVMGGTVDTADLALDDISIAGEIQGDAVISAGKSIRMSSGALIAGNLRYWSPEGETQFAGASIDNAVYDVTLAREMRDEASEGAALAALIGAISLFKLFSAALLIGVLLFVTKTIFTDSAKRLKAAPWKNMGMAFLYFAVTPIVVLLLLITVIGIPLALALAMVYVISIMFAKVIASMVFARWIEIRNKKSWHPVVIFFLSLVIYVGLTLLDVIPVIGWIACALLVLLGYGSFLSAKYARFEKVR